MGKSESPKGVRRLWRIRSKKLRRAQLRADGSTRQDEGQVTVSEVLGALVKRFRWQPRLGKVAVEMMSVERSVPRRSNSHYGGRGSRVNSQSNRRQYRTSDAWACIHPNSDKKWNDFFHFIGRNKLIGESSFGDIEHRVSHVDT